MEWAAEEGCMATAWDGTAAMLADVAALLDDPARTAIVDGGVPQGT